MNEVKELSKIAETQRLLHLYSWANLEMEVPPKSD